MRLPADSALIVLDGGGEAVDRLRALWAREGLPAFEVLAVDAFVRDDLEARLDAAGVTTLVVCGTVAEAAFRAALKAAAERGYRVFVPREAGPAGLDLGGFAAGEVRLASLAEALIAGENALARRRWRAPRR